MAKGSWNTALSAKPAALSIETSVVQKQFLRFVVGVIRPTGGFRTVSMELRPVPAWRDSPKRPGGLADGRSAGNAR